MHPIPGPWLRSLALVPFAAVFLQSGIVQAAHPVVVYSQRLPFPPHVVTSLSVDHSGTAYVLGNWYYAGGAYVSKLDASGNLWTVRIGGTPSEKCGCYLDSATAVATDKSGNVYVAGSTSSPDFPTVNAIQPHLGGGWDAFLAKLSPEGKILYSTYLGGTDADFATGVAVDLAGNVYVTGTTGSADFPTVAPLQAALRGTRDAFVLKIDPAGRLVYSTYLGGSGDADTGRGIAVDPSGNVFVTGEAIPWIFPQRTRCRARLEAPHAESQRSATHVRTRSSPSSMRPVDWSTRLTLAVTGATMDLPSPLIRLVTPT